MFTRSNEPVRLHVIREAEAAQVGPVAAHLLKTGATRGLLALLGTWILLIPLLFTARGEEPTNAPGTNPPPPAAKAARSKAARTQPPSRLPEEKDACTRNLETIRDAIQAYKNDHGDLPNWLSDLVPHYISDTNVLICPVCLRTGRTEGRPLADPKIASSYLFEFCPIPIGGADPNAAKHSRREWKLRQMEIAGPVVPIVRCRHHTPVLNLSYNGRIYEGPPSWEDMLTNRLNPEDLKPARIFAVRPDKPAPPPVVDDELTNAAMSIRAAPVVAAAPVKLERASTTLSPPQATGITNILKELSFPASAKTPSSEQGSNPPMLSGWVPVILWCGGMAAVTLAIGFFIAHARTRARARPAAPRLLTATAGQSSEPSCTVVISSPSLTASTLVESPVRSVASPPLRLPPQPGKNGTLRPEQRTWVDGQLQREQTIESSTLLSHLSQWLKQKLVQKLIVDRAQLMRTQEAASLKMRDVDERLARVEIQVQEQNRAYEVRISELNRELLVAKEENRELIRARIEQVKAEMQAARARVMRSEGFK